jgi:hypothetical protein
VDGCRAVLAPYFNLTVELSLKVLRYSWTAIPIYWLDCRRCKAKPKEMESRYLYIRLEKYFGSRDYCQQVQALRSEDQALVDLAAGRTW